MFDQYGATDETASPSGGGPGFGAGAAGFDASEIFRNIFTGGFGNAGFDIFGNGPGGFNGQSPDVAV